MTFSDWLFYTSDKPTIDNPAINGKWGLWHIVTMIVVFCLYLIANNFNIRQCESSVFFIFFVQVAYTIFMDKTEKNIFISFAVVVGCALVFVCLYLDLVGQNQYLLIVIIIRTKKRVLHLFRLLDLVQTLLLHLFLSFV